MAFRATRKTTPKTDVGTDVQSPSDAPESIVPAEPVFSVEDLVGAPVASQPSAEFVAPEPQSMPSIPVTPAETQPMQPEPYINQQHNRGGYTSRENGGYQRGGTGGGYGGNRGRYNPRDRRGGYGMSGGAPRRDIQRRDFVIRPGNGGEIQDINVPTETVSGILDVMSEGHGFIRPKFTPSDRDIYISQSQIRRFMLRNGDKVEGQARQPKENERYWGLLKVEKINEQPSETMQNRPRYEDLVPIYPNKLLVLETGLNPLSTRIIDLVAPIGFGQRGLIVSPPKAGKTTILKEIAAGVTQNFPNAHLMAALIGERPEEVTDLTRNIKGEVLASNFDESPQEQTRVAEVALDRAKRLVEMGKDVVILLDSITRLARAYNMVVNPSGRTLSGGFDPAALYPAKKFLGAARCVEPKPGSGSETGGSLTVIGTALVETGSRMDDLIYEEFKGTGNMELHLSRALQERRIFPAIDIGKSGTRHDELLLGEENMKKITTLRHMLSMLSDDERTMMLVERLKKTNSNKDFLDSLSQGV